MAGARVGAGLAGEGKHARVGQEACMNDCTVSVRIAVKTHSDRNEAIREVYPESGSSYEIAMGTAIGSSLHGIAFCSEIETIATAAEYVCDLAFEDNAVSDEDEAAVSKFQDACIEAITHFRDKSNRLRASLESQGDKEATGGVDDASAKKAK